MASNETCCPDRSNFQTGKWLPYHLVQSLFQKPWQAKNRTFRKTRLKEDKGRQAKEQLSAFQNPHNALHLAHERDRGNSSGPHWHCSGFQVMHTETMERQQRVLLEVGGNTVRRTAVSLRVADPPHYRLRPLLVVHANCLGRPSATWGLCRTSKQNCLAKVGFQTKPQTQQRPFLPPPKCYLWSNSIENIWTSVN